MVVRISTSEDISTVSNIEAGYRKYFTPQYTGGILRYILRYTVNMDFYNIIIIHGVKITRLCNFRLVSIPSV